MIKYIILLLILHALNCFAVDVYVSCGENGVMGDDSYSGLDINHPKRTIKAGIDALKIQGPGNTLYIRGGTYTTIPIDQYGTCAIYFYYLNDATSWSNSYTIRSYPEEWAVIDASGYSVDQLYVFCGSTKSGEQGFIEFSHLEIKGAYGATGCAAIKTRGGPYRFRYLYIHDNNCGISNNNPGGLDLQNGTGDTLIEYCYFYRNGCILDGNSTNGQIVIYSDYQGSWGSQQLYNAEGFATARHSNVIRYNLIDGDGVSYAGYHGKSRQWLVNNPEGTATPVDVNNWSGYNNKIHHNIILNHREMSIGTQSDFMQVYNNITNAATGENTRGNICLGKAAYEHRAPWKNVAYNNTIIGGSQGGLVFNNRAHPPSDQIYSKCYAFNNIIEAPTDSNSNQDLTVNRYWGTKTWMDGGADANLQVFNNLFYKPNNSKLMRIIITDYTLAEINNATWGNDNYSNATANLYQDTTGADQYKTEPAFIVDGSTTILNGGIGGAHPYLSGVTIPSYIGAVNPNGIDSGTNWDPDNPDPDDAGWVDWVLDLPNSLGIHKQLTLGSGTKNLDLTGTPTKQIVFH